MSKVNEVIDTLERYNDQSQDNNDKNLTLRSIINVMLDCNVTSLSDAKSILEHYNIPFDINNPAENVDIFLSALYIYLKEELFIDGDLSDYDEYQLFTEQEKYETVLHDLVDSIYSSESLMEDTFEDFLYQVYFQLDVLEYGDFYEDIYFTNKKWNELRKYLRNFDSNFYDSNKTREQEIEIGDFIKVILLMFFEIYYKGKNKDGKYRINKFRSVLEDADNDASRLYKLSFLNRLYINPMYKVNALYNFYKPTFLSNDIKERTNVFSEFFTDIIKNLLKIKFKNKFKIQELKEEEIAYLVKQIKVVNDNDIITSMLLKEIEDKTKMKVYDKNRLKKFDDFEIDLIIEKLGLNDDLEAKELIRYLMQSNLVFENKDLDDLNSQLFDLYKRIKK